MLLNILIFTFPFVLLTIKVHADECGVVKFIEPQITGGNVISRGEWPFIAALYYTDDAKFFCGGSLISAKHVLSAAHCVQQKNFPFKLTPEDVVVLLGAYNLDLRIERGVQQLDVTDILIHPDWKAYHEKYDADIAIFLLIRSVEFTNYIRPVCIPTDDARFDGVKGSIVGWGLARNTSKCEPIPRHAFTTALNDSYCYTTEKFLAIFSSTRTFCGGGDGGRPNKGDSGGGFFVLSGSVWTQYGIISASLSDSNGFVLPNSFSVYTNVKSFRNWIGSIVGPVEPYNLRINVDLTHKTKIEVNCKFKCSPTYRCTVWESNVTVDDAEVEIFSGTHLTGYDNQNVTQLWFWNGNVASIPDGIGLIFRRLEKLLVGYYYRNLGLKSIKRSNFKDMPHLTLLHLYDNYIETVDVDTLWDVPHLEVFLLENGRLKVLPEKLFERNTKLQIVNANGNQIEFLPKELFKHNPLLLEVLFKDNKLRSISVNFFDLKVLRIIDLDGNICIAERLDDISNLTEFQDLVSMYC